MAFTPAAYPQGTDVWLPDEAEVWVKAVAFEQTPEQVTFRRQGGAFVVGKVRAHPRLPCWLPCHPPA